MGRLSWLAPVGAFGLTWLLLGCGGGALVLDHPRNGRVVLVASTTDNKIQTFKSGNGDLAELTKDVETTAGETTSTTETITIGIRTTQEPTLGMTVADEHLYTATDDGKIEQYRIKRSGELEGMSPSSVPLPDGLGGIAATPDAKWLFASGSPNQVYQYAIDSDGKLVANASPTVNAGNQPVDIQITPNGLHLYVANRGDGTISQFSVGGDGTLTPLSPAIVATPSGAHTMAIDKTGTYLYAACADTSQIAIYHIQSNGALTHTSNVAAAQNAQSLALEPIDALFAYSASVENVEEIKRYSIGGGSLTELTPPRETDYSHQTRMAFSPEGFLYVSDSDNHRVSVYRVQDDGTLSHMRTKSTIDDPGPLVFRYLP